MEYYGVGLLGSQVISALIGVIKVLEAIAPRTFPVIQNAVTYPLLGLLVCVWRIPYLGAFYKALFARQPHVEGIGQDIIGIESETLDLLPGWPLYFLYAVILAVSDVGTSAALIYAFTLAAKIGNSITTLSVEVVSSLSLVLVPIFAVLISHTAFNLYNMLSLLLAILGVGLMFGAKAVAIQMNNGKLFAMLINV